MIEGPSNLIGKSKPTAVALFKAVRGFTFRSMRISACEMTAHTFSSWGSDLELAAVYFFETKENLDEVHAGAGSQPVVLTTL